MKTSKQKIYSVFIFVLSALIFLLIAEYTVRVLRLSKSDYPAPWPFNLKEIPWEYQQNAYGWRDREFSKEKGAGLFRVACVGDSVTEGFGVGWQDSFPKFLEKYLWQDGLKAEVMNLGKSVANTEENLAALKTALEFNPDLVIYQFGMNDIIGFEHIQRLPPEGGVVAQPPPKKKAPFNLRVFLRKSILYRVLGERFNYLKLRIGYRNWDFGEYEIMPIHWQREIEKLKNGLSGVHPPTDILLVYMPYEFQIYSRRDEVFIPSRILSQFCQEQGLYFLDFTLILKKERRQGKLFLDDCHLSVYGNSVVAKCLKEFIVDSILKKEKG